MLNITIKNGDIVYTLEDIDLNKTELEKADFFGEYIYHTPEAGADARRLFVRRDSFSSALMPFLATEFEDSIFVHQESFSQQQIFDYDSDIFVLEVVERNIPQLEEVRISYISYSVEEGEGENKIIRLAPALTDADLRYVSIFKKISGTDEVIKYQVLEDLDRSSTIRVPKDENGEIYVYVFGDADGENILEERTITY